MQTLVPNRSVNEKARPVGPEVTLSPRPPFPEWRVAGSPLVGNGRQLMGFLAVYIAIDDPTLDAMWQLDDGPFLERFYELEEEGHHQRLQIDKIWDALHCTLTGASASTPIEGDKLSECIVGVYPRLWENEDATTYISVIDNEDLGGILAALADYDAKKLASLLDPAQMKKQNVYPRGIWEDDKRGLVAEMDTALREVRGFFRRSQEAGNHVLATIM